MHPPIITGVEHQSKDFSSYYKGWLATQSANWWKRKMLGLHPKNDGYAPGNFIGMIWIGEGDSRAVLHVHSKFDDPRMDYIKMYADCCAHPDIGSRMGKCFECWPDEDYIDTEDSTDFLSVIIISFLNELNQLCVRHLRKNFERRRENFIGKVKGKIIVSENLRQNIVRGRLDRVFCEYQSFSDDILENRILRAALERAARYVACSKDPSLGKAQDNLRRWIHACRAHLQGASVVPVSLPHFAAARKRGVFAFYRRPLHLAKAVLLNLGFNPHEEVSQGMKTLPYAINSERLFERYAELKLLTIFPNLLAPTGNILGHDKFDVPVRPDFYVPKDGTLPGNEPWVIDAKYKKNYDDPDREDIYQVVAYSRHRRLRQAMGCGENDNVHVSLAYPIMGDGDPFIYDTTDASDTTDAFLQNFSIYKIPCPKKDN